MYEVVTSTPQVAADLRKLVQWRNFFAHNAFRHELLARSGSSPFGSHSVEDVRKVVLAAREVVERLGKEVQQLQTTYRSVAGVDYDGSVESPT
jgi:hypothetical protein